MKEKYFDTEEGRIPHISLDGIRYYPKHMIEEFAAVHSTSLEAALEFIGEGSESLSDIWYGSIVIE